MDDPLREASDPSTSSERLRELWETYRIQHGLDEAVEEGEEKLTEDDLDERGSEALEVCRAIVRNPNVDTAWLNEAARFSAATTPDLAYNPSWPLWLIGQDHHALELLWLETTNEIDTYFTEHNGWEYIWVPEEKEDYQDATDLTGMYASFWDAMVLTDPNLSMEEFWEKLQSATEHYLSLTDDDRVEGGQMMLVQMTDKQPFSVRFAMLETFAREQAARAIRYLHRSGPPFIQSREERRRTEYRPLFLKVYRGEPLPPLGESD